MKVAADIVVRRGDQILFVRRRNAPFAGLLALPGGFVEDHETVEMAGIRELEEETAIRVSQNDLKLIGVFSDPDRDPRGRIISVAYAIDLPEGSDVRAGGDAATTEWLSADDAIRAGLAFDHADILKSAQ